MSDLRQEQFLEVIGRDEAERRFRAHLDLTPLEAETVPLDDALGRVLSEDVASPIDVPGFDRANVDGFAVRSADTFGASEDRPVALRLNDEVLPTGVAPRIAVVAGSATPIATGAVLPRGADAVVMVEHTDVRAGALVVSRPVVPGANVTFAGTDIGRGEVVLRRGEVLAARETGVLAALGAHEVAVVRRPRVAVLSTGDELVPPGAPLPFGCVYDSNATVLCDAVRELGGEPLALGIVPDDEARLEEVLRGALSAVDVVLLSGGTSKGAGDVSYRVVGRLGAPGIVVHGVALKPGKPLCLAVVQWPGRRPVPVAVLPGFPTSAIFTFHEFLAPVLRQMAGQRQRRADIVEARLPLRLSSERGRTEYVLVSLVRAPVEQASLLAPSAAASKQDACSTEGDWVAYPLGKGSGSVTAFARADGFVVIPRQREYLEEGDRVAVHRLAAEVWPADLVVIGSHCTGLDYLLGELARRGVTCKTMAVGSSGGLEAAKRGECDLAGVHLLDPATDTYNRPFLTEALDLVPGYGRLQGIVYRRGDARFKGRTVSEAIAAALADPSCVMVNRNRGSGTRALIDRLLEGVREVPGFLAETRSHNAVVAAVVQGRADWGVAIAPVARDYGLGFLPLRAERYDFVVPKARRGRPAVEAFVALLAESTIRQGLVERGFEVEGEA